FWCQLDTKFLLSDDFGVKIFKNTGHSLLSILECLLWRHFAVISLSSGEINHSYKENIMINKFSILGLSLLMTLAFSLEANAETLSISVDSADAAQLKDRRIGHRGPRVGRGG